MPSMKESGFVVDTPLQVTSQMDSSRHLRNVQDQLSTNFQDIQEGIFPSSTYESGTARGQNQIAKL